jgi:hypothetical protein
MRSCLLLLCLPLSIACDPREPSLPLTPRPTALASAPLPAPSQSDPATPTQPASPRSGTPSPIYRVGGEVSEPVELERVPIVIPEECRHCSFAGIFVFEAVIDETGRVQAVHTLRAPDLKPPCPALEQAHISSISRWRYKPATLRGRPVPVYLTVTALLH